jgi:anti-sigma factor RsiW
MDHARFRANHTAALYVNGDLDERAQESFELHLISCVSCVEDVEIWRAMRSGMRETRAAGTLERTSHAMSPGQWRLAASLVAIAVGSGVAGWYTRSLTNPALADEAIAVFNLPPTTRGDGDCEQLPVAPSTALIALRVPGAARGSQLEVTDALGVPLSASEYAVRTQADGSWLLRTRVRAFDDGLLRLQTRAADGSTEPLACLQRSGS